MHVVATNAFFSVVGWFIYVVLIVLVIAGMWKTFVKAGKPGWGAIIPFFNTYLAIKIAGRPGWWLILLFIPIVDLIIWIIVCLGIAENFGHGAGYGILLFLFAPIMFLVLGFGSDQYKPIRPERLTSGAASRRLRDTHDRPGRRETRVPPAGPARVRPFPGPHARPTPGRFPPSCRGQAHPYIGLKNSGFRHPRAPAEGT